MQATLAAAAAPVLAAGVYLGIVRPARWAYRRFRAAAVTREDLEAAKRAQKLVDAGGGAVLAVVLAG